MSYVRRRSGEFAVLIQTHCTHILSSFSKSNEFATHIGVDRCECGSRDVMYLMHSSTRVLLCARSLVGRSGLTRLLTFQANGPV